MINEKLKKAKDLGWYYVLAGGIVEIIYAAELTRISSNKLMEGIRTPGTFTNQMQKSFTEPRLLILTDPRTDHQPIMEASLGNIPTISFCDTDSPMSYVDISIPANNKVKNNIGCLFWMLARMVLQMRGTIFPGHKWDVMVDLFFYSEPEEAKDQEVDESGALVPEYGVIEYEGAGMITNDQWGSDAQWAGEVVAAPALAGGVDWTDAGVPVAGGDAAWESVAPPSQVVDATVIPPPSGWE